MISIDSADFPSILIVTIVSGVLLGGLMILFMNLLHMYRDPGYHPWPGVTRCRICENRVFAWQRKERRAFNVNLDNPQHVACGVSASGIVHKSCQGNPVFEIGVRVS